VSAREEVLGRISAAHRAAPPPDLPYDQIVRGYRTTSSLDAAELADRLVDRLLDYRALVRRCRAGEVSATLAAALTERGVRTVVVPAGLDETWLTSVPDAVTLRVDGTDSSNQLSVAELDAVDAVVSGCAVAIAETGTLVLSAGPGQGRRVISLIPDYHLCVVGAEQICADVPQALARLDLTEPTTMISGPSATSDIELDRVEGVHGPRTLEVIVVEPLS
jgi:L-lactate dehydrogenase complex protein LldG